MQTQIGKWGNSLAVRLPRHVAEAAGLREGSNVELDVAAGVVRIALARPSYRLEELLAGITPDNLHDSFDDRARGAEAL